MVVAAAVSVLVGVWGVAIEPRLIEVEEETAAIPDLPAEWEGRRMALIADLQVEMWLNNTDTLRRITTRLVEERPAAVLIAGDFVYEATDDEPDDLDREDFLEFKNEVAEVVGIVRPLTDARIPVLAVLGNHDYGMMAPQHRKNDRLAGHLRAALEAAGVRVLDAAAVPLAAPAGEREPRGGIAGARSSVTGAPLYFVGVGSRFAGADRPEVALAQVPNGAARVVMMHNPDSFLLSPSAPRRSPSRGTRTAGRCGCHSSPAGRG